MRLALACGRHDVDSMLDEMTPQQFDQWRALEALEGFGNEKLQNTIAIGFSLIARGLGAEIEWWHLIPGMEDPTPKATPEQAARIFGQLFGGRKNGDNR